MEYFAGPIFSTNQVIMLILGLVVFAGATLFVAMLVIKKYVYKKSTGLKDLALWKLLFGVFVLVGIGVLVGIVLPIVQEDNRQAERQEICAEYAGYDSPADDNDGSKATAASQRTYRVCLDDSEE